MNVFLGHNTNLMNLYNLECLYDTKVNGFSFEMSIENFVAFLNFKINDKENRSFDKKYFLEYKLTKERLFWIASQA